MKRLTLVFICIFIFLMAGCQSQDVLPNDDPTPPVHSSDADENTPGSDILTNSPANPGNDSTGIDTTGFQKEMNIQHPFRLWTSLFFGWHNRKCGGRMRKAGVQPY